MTSPIKIRILILYEKKNKTKQSPDNRFLLVVIYQVLEMWFPSCSVVSGRSVTRGREHHSSNSSCQNWWRQPVWPEKKPILLPNREMLVIYFTTPTPWNPPPPPPPAAGFIYLKCGIPLSHVRQLDSLNTKWLKT